MVNYKDTFLIIDDANIVGLKLLGIFTCIKNIKEVYV